MTFELTAAPISAASKRGNSWPCPSEQADRSCPPASSTKFVPHYQQDHPVGTQLADATDQSPPIIS